jgi:transcriptional regulator with PAS, ATPase and Fis domain
MPPRRDRGDDIFILASHFIAKFNQEEKKNFVGLSAEVASMFRRYDLQAMCVSWKTHYVKLLC